MDSDFWGDVSFVQMSSNRSDVLQILVDAGRPMTPTELGDEMEIVVKSASRAVRQLHDRDLVTCVNPEAPRDRRYRPTDRGREVQREIVRVEERDVDEIPVLEEPSLEYAVEAPEEVQDDVSYVRTSRNRQDILAHLSVSDIPLTPSDLADAIGIGFNSASRAVRQLVEHGLARCVTPDVGRYRRYEPTDRGERVIGLLRGED